MNETLVPSSRKSTLDFLVRRMQQKSDFPALSSAVSAINRVASSERESLDQLSNSVLKDFALTNKILRLVNAAYYRSATGGSISTVSRAILVLGFDAIRNIAISVVLFEHLESKQDTTELKEAFVKTNLAGIISRELCVKIPAINSEQAYICAMFVNLGRLLRHFYFPEEGESIRECMRRKSCSEDEAMLHVMGISFEDLGIEVAQMWGFPLTLINSMKKLPDGTIRKPAFPEERLQVVSGFANELCDVITNTSPQERDEALGRLAARFKQSLPISERDLQKTARAASDDMSKFASVINLNLKESSLWKQFNGWIAEGSATADEAITLTSEQVTQPLVSLSALEPVARAGDEMETGGAESVLTAGIQDISNTLVEDFRLNDVLRIIMETMYRAKGFRRVILCIRDRAKNRMVGRFGFGADSMDMARRMQFPMTDNADVFQAALKNNVDILINDANSPQVSNHIPEWFRQQIGAETFVIFPLSIKNSPVALIYADGAHAGDIVIPEKELALLRTLRNQAVLAIKQSA